jgi:hypothetical protein
MSAAADSEVLIKFATPGVVHAVVRDLGCHEVRWTTYRGFECSCHVDDCAHVAAVAQLVGPRGGDDR